VVDGYRVDPDGLVGTDRALAAVGAGARAEFEAVRAEAARLLGSGWRGPAASAFALGWAQWSDGAAAMLAALDELAALVGSAGAGYGATDDAVRAAIARS
jgi:WXG100 family type VII secretion target